MQSPRWLPYVAPFVAYLLLTQIPPKFPDRYALLYTAVVAVVGALTWWMLRGKGLIRPHRDLLPAIAVGVAGAAVWIGLCELRLESRIAGYLPEWLAPGARAAFDPFHQIADPVARWAFIAVRLAGLVVLVPIAEELFFRGFLHRWMISADWDQVEIGRYSTTACLVVILLFTAAHPEWFAAAAYAALLNGLLYWKRDLWSCIVAHATSNLLLAAYVLATGEWRLW